jgi:rod shape-determining protein MreC
MEYGPPPLFNQGVSARARLAFFSVCASVLIIIDAQAGILDPIRSGVEVLLLPIQKILLLPRQAASGVGAYFSSKTTLTLENNQLREDALNRSVQLREMERLRTENEQLRSYGGLSERVTGPTRVVRVLFEARDPFSHRVVVDRGERDGMLLGSPVMDEQGVVGQVTRVFPAVSEVTLITDKGQSLPVQVVRNGLHAIAFGSSENGSLELRYLPANVDVDKGDLVVTSGLDGIYPVGVPVAQVSRVERDVKDQFARVVLRPTAGFGHNPALLVLLSKAPSLPAEPDDGHPQTKVRVKGGGR